MDLADRNLERVARLFEPEVRPEVRAAVEQVLRSQGEPDRVLVRRTLDEVKDLEDRVVHDVLGRDGEPVAEHHYRACRAEDEERSWDHRPARAPIRALRDAMMASALGPRGLDVRGVDALRAPAGAGKRFLFIANHESVFDLVTLSHALAEQGLGAIADRLTFFVNPKIFNTPFWNLFICKSVGLIKMPQSPRIAANESVMEPAEVRRRAAHGFEVAGARLAAGDSLAIYPEGLRSRGELHRFARAYLDLLRPETLARRGLAPDAVYLVPWAHRGLRALETLSAETPEVAVRFGEPIAPARFFGAVGDRPPGVAAHLAGYLVARLLPPNQRGLYGDDPARYLDHPHYRQRIKEHTLADVLAARPLADAL